MQSFDSTMASKTERRRKLRKRPLSLVYVELPAANGGMMRDLSEEGFALRAMMPLRAGEKTHFSFSLNESTNIEGEGEILWVEEQGRVAGIRFIEVSPSVPGQIREWLSKADQPSKRETTPAKPLAPVASTMEELHEELRASPARPTPEEKKEAVPPSPSIVADAPAPAVNSVPQAPTHVAEILQMVEPPSTSSPSPPPVASAPPAPLSVAPQLPTKNAESPHAVEPPPTNLPSPPVATAPASPLSVAPLASTTSVDTPKVVEPPPMSLPSPPPVASAPSTPVSVPPSAPTKTVESLHAVEPPPISSANDTVARVVSVPPVEREVSLVAMVLPTAPREAAKVPSVPIAPAPPEIEVKTPAVPDISTILLQPTMVRKISEPLDLPIDAPALETLPPLAQEQRTQHARWLDRFTLTTAIGIMLILALLATAFVYHREVGSALIWLGEKIAGTNQQDEQKANVVENPAPPLPKRDVAQGGATETGLSRSSPPSEPSNQNSMSTNSTVTSENMPQVRPTPANRSTLLPVTPLTGSATGATGAAANQEIGQEEYQEALQLLRGRNREAEMPEAVRLLWIAVEKGNPGAELALAELYWHGQGVTKNCDQTRILLSAAARKGNTEAQKRLKQFQQEGCE